MSDIKNGHNKIIVVGPSGAGKSYFSKQLASITGLPLYHLDNLFWKEDKTHISREQFDEKLLKILKQDKWIIDGDYSRTYELRIKYADTIYFLDFPLEVALEGVESRIGKPREDIPWKEDVFDPEFKQWIIDWYKNTQPWVYHLIEKYKDSKNIIVFKSREEIDSYVESCKKALLKGVQIQVWSPYTVGMFESSLFDETKHPEINVVLKRMAEKYHTSKCAIATAFIKTK